MIERIPFGSTGHDSSRIIFGAAALGGMKQDRADATLDLLLHPGVDLTQPPDLRLLAYDDVFWKLTGRA